MTSLKTALKEALVIFATVSVIALCFNQVRSNRLPLIGDWPDEVSVFSGLLTVTLDEAIGEFREGTTIFLDVRPQTAYQQGHIPQSVNLPYASFYEGLPALKDKISLNTRIITYGEEKEFPVSEDLAILLQESGFEDVKVFLDGWSHWRGAQLPVDKD